MVIGYIKVKENILKLNEFLHKRLGLNTEKMCLEIPILKGIVVLNCIS